MPSISPEERFIFLNLDGVFICLGPKGVLNFYSVIGITYLQDGV